MYMKCYRMRDQKKKNPECRYPVFILDFTNFAGFLHRCDEINPCSMQSLAENKVTRIGGIQDWTRRVKDGLSHIGAPHLDERRLLVQI